MAISPPVRSPRRSAYRLESLGDPSAGRPWLLRALVAAEASSPPAPRLSSPDAPVEAIAALPGRGAWFRVPVPPHAGAVRLRLIDPSGVHSLRAAVRPPLPSAQAPPLDERALVLEGTLVPELAGEVVARPAGSAAALRPVTDQVVVEPARGPVDACGLASFTVRVSGLGAPVSLVSSGPAGERRDELRLPLSPGGIAVRDDVGSVLLRATSPGPTAHLVAGDGSGPTWWTAAALGPDGDEGSARVALPAGVFWLTASPGSDLSAPVSPLVRPPWPPCVATPLGRRLARGRLGPPSLPALRVLRDGPAEGRRLARRGIQRARALCVAGLAAGIALEVLLLLGAGLAHGPVVLRPLTGSGRDRLGVLVAGISTLLLIGAAMALVVGLNSS